MTTIGSAAKVDYTVKVRRRRLACLTSTRSSRTLPTSGRISTPNLDSWANSSCHRVTSSTKRCYGAVEVASIADL